MSFPLVQHDPDRRGTQDGFTLILWRGSFSGRIIAELIPPTGIREFRPVATAEDAVSWAERTMVEMREGSGS